LRADKQDIHRRLDDTPGPWLTKQSTNTKAAAE
jgi:hypothetical protein